MNMIARAKSFLLGCMTASALVAAAGGCNRDRIEAIDRAAEGDKARAIGDFKSAADKYAAASDLDPDNHVILYRLAEAQMGLKEWAKVAAACAKAEAADEKQNKGKTFASYYWLDGFANQQLGVAGDKSKLEAAKLRYQKAIEVDPNYADAYRNMADVMLMEDDEQGALTNYTKAIEKKPDRITYYVPLADLYMGLGYTSEAAQVANEGLSFAKEAKEPKQGEQNAEGDSKNASVFNLHAILGNIAQQQGNLPEAITQFEASRKSCAETECAKYPFNLAYYYLGAAYAASNPPSRDQALEALKKFNRFGCKANDKKLENPCSVAAEIAARLKGTLN